MHRSVLDDAAVAHQNRPLAQAADRRHVVRHVQDGPALFRDVPHLRQAFLLKPEIADGENLVDHQYFRFEMRRHREGEAKSHPAGVALDRCVDEFADVREVDDIVEFAIDFLARHAQDRAVQIDVFTARQIADESRFPPPAGSRPGH